MKRALSFVCASLLALTLFTAALPAPVALAAGSDGTVTYRALSIGNAQYAGAELEAPEYDATHMQALFAQMSFDGVTMDPDNNKRENNLTKSGIKKAIAAAFAGADADDVSYFYYSGHGSVANGQAQQRHDDDVEPGDESRVGHTGEQQPNLLQIDPHRQRQAHAHAAQQQAALQKRLMPGRRPSLVDHQREQCEGAEGEAQPGKKERAYIVHADALRNEGGAPDHRGDQHQEIGTEGLATHVSARSKKAADFATKRCA